MTEATKYKLSKYVKDPFVRDMLESFGILYPKQIREASDDELTRAGLRPEEVEAIRAKLPQKAVESKEQ